MEQMKNASTISILLGIINENRTGLGPESYNLHEHCR